MYRKWDQIQGLNILVVLGNFLLCSCYDTISFDGTLWNSSGRSKPQQIWLRGEFKLKLNEPCFQSITIFYFLVAAENVNIGL